MPPRNLSWTIRAFKWPRPGLLTKEELKALPATLLEGGATQSISRALSAYEIKVTAHEQLGENQLELGPLARRIVINKPH